VVCWRQRFFESRSPSFFVKSISERNSPRMPRSCSVHSFHKSPVLCFCRKKNHQKANINKLYLGGIFPEFCFLSDSEHYFHKSHIGHFYTDIPHKLSSVPTCHPNYFPFFLLKTGTPNFPEKSYIILFNPITFVINPFPG